jgi:hypothetical protein
VTIDAVSERELRGPQLVKLWAGEHYRLAGLVEALRARRVVEIGTGTGLSALAMLSARPPEGRIVTFDIVPWHGYPGGVLRPEDFGVDRLEQRVVDLSESRNSDPHLAVLEDAELIFVDAAKDGETERRFLALFDALHFNREPVVVLDDIRVWTMLAIWGGVSRPKLDVSSFGHWSGTGLIDYR